MSHSGRKTPAPMDVIQELRVILGELETHAEADPSLSDLPVNEIRHHLHQLRVLVSDSQPKVVLPIGYTDSVIVDYSGENLAQE